MNFLSRTSIPVIVVMLSIILVSSCEKKNDDIAAPVSNMVILPLETLNTWHYQQVAPCCTGQMTSTIMIDTLMGTERWFHDGHFDGYTWVTNRSGGLYSFKNGITQLQYKYPAAANDTFWNGIRSVEVLSIDTLISTPMANFKCYAYKSIYSTSPTIIRKEYMAPGIGFVQIEEEENFTLTSRWALDSYTLH